MKKIYFFYVFLFIQLFYWASLKQIAYPHLISDTFSFLDVASFIDSLKRILPSFMLSMEIFFYVLFLNLVFAVSLSFYIVKMKFPSWLSLLFYIPVFAPAFLPAFGLYELFIEYELLGTKIGVVLGQSCMLFPFMIRPIELHLREQNFKYEQFAFDLGESSLRVFFKITLPLLYPSILMGTFMTLIGSFNDYLITFLLGDSLIETLPIKILPFFSSDNRSLIALSIITYLLPIFVITIFFKENKDLNHA